jgi:hypothetical protein
MTTLKDKATETAEKIKDAAAEAALKVSNVAKQLVH